MSADMMTRSKTINRGISISTACSIAWFSFIPDRREIEEKGYKELKTKTEGKKGNDLRLIIVNSHRRSVHFARKNKIKPGGISSGF